MSTNSPVRAPHTPGSTSSAMVGNSTKFEIDGDDDEVVEVNNPTTWTVKWPTYIIDHHDGDKSPIEADGKWVTILTPSATTVTGGMDATPVSDLTFVTPGSI